jgi:hypothetical protein
MLAPRFNSEKYSKIVRSIQFQQVNGIAFTDHYHLITLRDVFHPQVYVECNIDNHYQTLLPLKDRLINTLGAMYPPSHVYIYNVDMILKMNTRPTNQDVDKMIRIEVNAQIFEKKLIDATRFWKSFKTYLEKHAPKVFDKNGEVNRERLGDYCVDLLDRGAMNKLSTQYPKLTESIGE